MWHYLWRSVKLRQAAHAMYRSSHRRLLTLNWKSQKKLDIRRHWNNGIHNLALHHRSPGNDATWTSFTPFNRYAVNEFTCIYGHAIKLLPRSQTLCPRRPRTLCHCIRSQKYSFQKPSDKYHPNRTCASTSIKSVLNTSCFKVYLDKMDSSSKLVSTHPLPSTGMLHITIHNQEW